MAYKPTAYKKIFSKILAPLIRLVQGGNSDKRPSGAVLDFLFDAENRLVVFAKAKSAFKMPGRPWDSLDFPHTSNHITKKRDVATGNQMVIRLDKRSVDNYCEIEYNKTVFVLTKAQWSVIRPKVDVVG